MGADLVLATLTWENGKKLDWDAGFSVLESYARSVWDKSREEDIALDDVLLDDNVGYTYQEVRGALTDIRNAFTGTLRRDISVLAYPPYKIAITGGMSWGDSPTDLYNSISMIDDIKANILGAIGFVHKLIDYKSLLDKIIGVETIRPLLMGLDKDLDEMIEQSMKE